MLNFSKTGKVPELKWVSFMFWWHSPRMGLISVGAQNEIGWFKTTQTRGYMGQ